MVLNGERVIDPETILNAIRNIGIIDNRIVEISLKALKGRETIDVTGLVVSPGFIELPYLILKSSLTKLHLKMD